MSVPVRSIPHQEALRMRFLGNQKKITFSFIVLLCFASILLLNYLFLDMQLLELVNEGEKLKKSITTLEKRRDKYYQEQVMLSSLQRIEFIAKEQLGMVVPTRKDRVYLARPSESE